MVLIEGSLCVVLISIAAVNHLYFKAKAFLVETPSYAHIAHVEVANF